MSRSRLSSSRVPFGEARILCHMPSARDLAGAWPRHGLRHSSISTSNMQCGVYLSIG
jgi:hypothetical protein